MMYKITSNIDEWVAKGRQVKQVINSSRTRQAVTRRWTKLLQRFTADNFQSEGSGSWPQLSTRYSAFKGSRGAGILRLRDDLYRSLTSRTGNSVITSKKTSFGFDFAFGTTDKKAASHHFGSGKLPKRKVFDIGNDERNKMQEAYGDVVIQKMLNIGFFDGVTTPRFTVTSLPKVNVQRF